LEPKQRPGIVTKVDRSPRPVPIILITHFSHELRKRIPLNPQLSLQCALAETGGLRELRSGGGEAIL
jgi:hypothetical protein